MFGSCVANAAFLRCVQFSWKRFIRLGLTATCLFAGFSFADNINVNGANRSMSVYAPSGIEKDRPLIIQMHGMNQDAKYQRDASKWEGIADTARFVIVFPEGEGKSWDINGDKDVNFLKAIINEMNNKYGIDKNRVYVSGFSMGGMMSYHAANKMGEMIAAIAPVSGYPIGNPAPASKRMMPIIHTHGTTDDVVNYNSAVSYLKKWVSYEKCGDSKVTKPYPENKPGSAAFLEVWSGCDQSEIRLMSITGKGHWYSMDEASVNSSVEIWNFVKRFSLDGSDIAPAIQVPVNRDSIFNGGFDSSAVAWDLQLHGDAKAEGSVADGAYKLDISAVGSEAYTVQLVQHNLHLEKGQWYEVSFDAKALAEHVLEVNVEQHTDPWASYLDAVKKFDVGTEQKNFKFEFQMNSDTDEDSRLSFNAASSTGTLFLDNVVLKKIQEPPMKLYSRMALNQRFALFKVYNLNGSLVGAVKACNGNIRSALISAGFKNGTYALKGIHGEFLTISVIR